MVQPAQEIKHKKEPLGQGIHPFLEIEGGSGEQKVDNIADCSLEIVPGQTKSVFQTWLWPSLSIDYGIRIGTEQK